MLIGINYGEYERTNRKERAKYKRYYPWTMINKKKEQTDDE